MHSLKQFANLVKTQLLADVSGETFSCLLRPRAHPPLLARRRAELIISRVRLAAALFALLTPLWIVVDVLVFEFPLYVLLAAGRIATTLAFAAVAWRCVSSPHLRDAYRALAWLFIIPTLFFVYSHLLLSGYQHDGTAEIVASGYAFLPFVLLASLSVFPLTALEGGLLAFPVLLSEALVALIHFNSLNWGTHLGAFWLLLLIAVTSILAGMSQLAFMEALVRQATHDPLARCFSRASGEALLSLQLNLAERSGAPLAVVFVDLDKFKSINDKFGHEAGDKVLIAAVDSMRSILRSSDILVRWGGEEFVAVLPNCNGTAAVGMLKRLRAVGLGERPDGLPVTASYGVAERMADSANDCQHLVEIADHRMYLAKEGGRDRWVGCEDAPVVPASDSPAMPGIVPQAA